MQTELSKHTTLLMCDVLMPDVGLDEGSICRVYARRKDLRIGVMNNITNHQDIKSKRVIPGAGSST